MAFRPLDLARDDDVGAIVRWSNDPAIRHLHTWCPDEATYRERDTPAAARERLRKAAARGKRVDLILVDGALAGQVSLEVDPPQLHRACPGSAWFGLVIGEARARGRGVGAAAMRHIEEAARAAGCVRAEIGVFEFNAAARRLYARLGYVEFARLPAFTWWDGRMWADLRLEKALGP